MMTKFGKRKVKTPTSENRRVYRVVGIQGLCYACLSFLNRSFVIFTSFSFVLHLSLKQFINKFIPFPSFHEKRKAKRRKRKKPWRNHQALFSCQRFVVPASIKSNCIPPQQYVQKVSPTPPRPTNKLRVLFDIVSLRPRPNVHLFMR